MVGIDQFEFAQLINLIGIPSDRASQPVWA